METKNEPKQVRVPSFLRRYAKRYGTDEQTIKQIWKQCEGTEPEFPVGSKKANELLRAEVA